MQAEVGANLLVVVQVAVEVVEVVFQELQELQEQEGVVVDREILQVDQADLV
jgi:hypothetical protein